MRHFNANNYSADHHEFQNSGNMLMRHPKPAGNMLGVFLLFFAVPLSFYGCGDISNVSGTPSKNANLSNLTVSPGALQPAFSGNLTNYTVDVASSVPSVTVTAHAQDATATVSINGQKTTSRSVTLGAEGSSTPISVVVTAQNGSQNTYSVT